MKKQAGPASVELRTDADLEKYIADSDASVIGELMTASFSFRFGVCALL